MSLHRYSESQCALPAMASWPASVHLFDTRQISALQAAEAAGRPLLVRGQPGTGKSQLAHAAAVASKRMFLPFVVDSRTEASELMWRYDAVARLADAHLAGVPDSSILAQDLQASHYIQPGPLWWAFDWDGARKFAESPGMRVNAQLPQKPPYPWSPNQGVVLLIDEIDKAEAELPNGLLEALGNGGFQVPMVGLAVGRSRDIPPPLVVITTNDERELPAAFLRRCMVLRLDLPSGQALSEYLVELGRLHFPRLGEVEDLLLQTASELIRDRDAAISDGIYAPGVAEYLDLLRVLQAVADQGQDPLACLIEMHEFAFKKQSKSDLV